ncbi:unnamed protein product [Taenia asiatica]|uniref:Uncharacterized protein n=1 Tax=Taenia asiatica TaxID=60517 RepID=A0A0R3W077_TAEAS|nr:unnamed protein product [Taenia asiatica]
MCRLAVCSVSTPGPNLQIVVASLPHPGRSLRTLHISLDILSGVEADEADEADGVDGVVEWIYRVRHRRRPNTWPLQLAASRALVMP